MTQITNTKKAKPLTRKEARRRVYEKLVSALSDLKTGSGSGKKFNKKLEKASKLFAPYLLKGKPVPQSREKVISKKAE